MFDPDRGSNDCSGLFEGFQIEDGLVRGRLRDRDGFRSRRYTDGVLKLLKPRFQFHVNPVSKKREGVVLFIVRWFSIYVFLLRALLLRCTYTFVNEISVSVPQRNPGHVLELY